MTLRRALTVAVVLLGAAVCVRLGFWQISRLHEKQHLNAQLRSAMANPPRQIEETEVPLEAIRDRPVELHGWYDEAHQLLLTGRSHGGSPGVHIVTPLRLMSGRAVLVDRGWVYAGDAATALPQHWPEPGERTVIGLAEPIHTGGLRFPLRRVPTDTIEVWSARALDSDSLRQRIPYALAPWMVRQLPGDGVPPEPVRETPKPYDEFTHISYAIQWFLFAVIFLFGPPLVLRSRRRRDRGGVSEVEPELYRSN
jgi:surfeit locus 1 family protein